MQLCDFRGIVSTATTLAANRRNAPQSFFGRAKRVVLYTSTTGSWSRLEVTPAVSLMTYRNQREIDFKLRRQTRRRPASPRQQVRKAGNRLCLEQPQDNWCPARR